ncbi:MAG: dehydrogenase [Gemmatimonadales bacterium]|uniref:alpha-ketoacid dehydrogenase subunit alpha/beta n=1 Tax=Candidatus Palauibacter polyketidifaciens TaxID=3056740 RepID=UPI00137D364F|nr:dehydrogenase E1 component subunit alpha/beta [Candidatus Palauibacter polyketidifaciens]MDE2720081.1 dehydrogenase E1 component subunit alpha/beta [Candidatus Palauibacter polyketidifaciens]MXX68279.1 dehydrogenase [Gemmatimonadales bacterium]MYG19720.1 dehydrogenase [Gemmatimonadales bacterium]MYH08887.1 dehydrogenase [Gemmatimonadales bacterium]
MATPIDQTDDLERALSALARPEWRDLQAEDLLAMYRVMYTSRTIDDREIAMKRQNRIFFQISGAGHEALLVAAGRALKPGHDWFFTYYRDRALCLELGMSPYEMFLGAVGAEEDPSTGGRQMPAHFGSRALHIVTPSSPTGTQFNQAVGCAEGIARARTAGLDDLDAVAPHVEADEIVLVCTGDGTTSEGEFWEAMNTASNLQLPILFLVEDNGYAISVPVEVNTAGGSISSLVRNFPNLHVEEVDGTDPLESYVVMRRAARYVRSGRGPALVHAQVTRPYSHSMSDDERLYKSDSERELESARDPLVTFADYIVREGVIEADELESLKAEIKADVADAADRAMARPQPAPETVYTHVYSHDVDPRSSAFETEARPEPEGNPKTMVDLLNACIRDEMRRDPRIVVFGQDVADASREELLDEVKGKGGVFKVTHGLQREFGSLRVYNAPLAEANIVGRAAGLAVRGLKPVAEVQFFDYIWPAYHQFRNEVATFRWRSAGRWKCPLVIRTTYGGYITGGAMYHSQTGASLFTHTPGMHVICPSNAEDANGLLRTAIRCDDPVLFLEHKHLYRQTYNKGIYPGPEYMIPFGKAAFVAEGDDLTIVTYGAMVERTRKALAKLERAGEPVRADLIDLRSLNPVDMDSIRRSVMKTNRVLVAYEDAKSWGYGAEISARLADELFEWLDAPIRRITSTDTFIGYAPSLENASLPQVDDIAEAIVELATW